VIRDDDSWYTETVNVAPYAQAPVRPALSTARTRSRYVCPEARFCVSVADVSDVEIVEYAPPSVLRAAS
jgi:hypothetical protein